MHLTTGEFFLGTTQSPVVFQNVLVADHEEGAALTLVLWHVVERGIMGRLVDQQPNDLLIRNERPVAADSFEATKASLWAIIRQAD